MSEIILHNYPQSPVAEKVRVALGIKQATWRSVEIPRIPPKPNLVKLTGGYRRTPVMQIGADIYCDSAHIMRVLDGRPGPTLQPRVEGLIWFLSRYTDGEMFSLAVKLVLGSAGDALPADFAEDRGRLYLGPDWAEKLKAANADLPHYAAQMRASLSWLDDLLKDGRTYLIGEEPGVLDAQVYHVVWFLRGRWDQGAAFLAEFENLARWEDTVRDLGHGTSSDMTAEEAIAIAAAASPAHSQGVAAGDPQGLSVGQKVVIRPDVDGGEQPVDGTIWAANAEEVTILRREPDCGDLCVHFPRAGYRIDSA